MSNFQYCVKCSKKLTPYELKINVKNCTSCRCEGKIEKMLSNHNLADLFSYRWTEKLFLDYYDFLRNSGLQSESTIRNLNKAKQLFLLAEKELLRPSDITINWLDNRFDGFSIRGLRKSLITFLSINGILKENLQEISDFKSLDNSINKFPTNFKNNVKIYCNNRLEMRKRQILNKSDKPLLIKTIQGDVEQLFRLIKFISENFPDVTSWDLIQEQHVNEFLLPFGNNSNKEHIRRYIYAYFKFLKSKKMIFHIPMLNVPTREFMTTTKLLEIHEQKIVSCAIQNSVFDNPLRSLISSFCFYQVLSSHQIRNIKLKDIDVSRKRIFVDKRAPVFLCNEELLSLKQYLEIRLNLKNVEQKSYLIANSTYGDNPIPGAAIAKYVKELTGYTPQILRMTSLNVYAERYGPQFLVEALGISLTHSSRFGKLSEFLIEEEIKNQRNVELKKQLLCKCFLIYLTPMMSKMLGAIFLYKSNNVTRDFICCMRG
jgi:hypothetical protein